MRFPVRRGASKRGLRPLGGRATRPDFESLECRGLMSGVTDIDLDLGTSSSPGAAGWVGVPLVQYSASRGYGWQGTRGIIAVDRGAPNALNRDFQGGSFGTFNVDVLPGSYVVTTSVGDNKEAHNGTYIFAEGALFAANVSTKAGEFVRSSGTVQVSDGRLSLSFYSLISARFALDGIQIHREPDTMNPTANAGPGQATVEGSAVAFNGSATGFGAASYSWDFGDGTGTTGTLNPSHVYQDNGTFTTTLTVSDGRSTARGSAPITVANQAPTAAIVAAPASSPEGTPIVLRGVATDPGPADSLAGFEFAWLVTKGGVAFASGAGPDFTFIPDDDGTYGVAMTATDKDGGISAPATRTVVVTNVAPTAAAGGPYSGGAGQGLTFRGSASDPSVRDAAAGYVWAWDFGDGTPTVSGSGLTSPSHVYASPGTYTAVATVADKDGGVGTSSASVTVQPPTSEGSLLFDFGYYGPVAPGSVAINLDGYSASRGYGWTALNGFGSESDGADPLLSGWDGGSSGTFRVDLPNGTYTVTAYLGDETGIALNDVIYDGQVVASSWTNPGQHFEPTFQATVVDGKLDLSFSNEGNYYFFKLNGLRIQHPIAVDAGADQSSLQGNTVDFAGRAFPGIGAAYSWDFGDGTTAAGSLSSRHIYQEGGDYTATLTVTDGFGVSMSSAAQVHVTFVAPVVTISGNPTSIPAGTPIDLTSSVTYPSASVAAAGATYSWTVTRDGVAFASGNGPTLSIVPQFEGTYVATLTARDIDGLSGVASVTLPVINPGHLPTIRVSGDTIPNFVAHPTIVSLASGRWSDPAIWSTGRLPTDGDIVEVAAGTTVSYDVASATHLGGVGVQPGGTLRFRGDVVTRMYVTNLVVFAGGTLEIGTASAPVAPDITATILINDVPLDMVNDPSQYGNGLIALGTISIHGAEKAGHVRLAAEPHAGDTSLTLTQPATGWRVGDRIFVPDTRQLDWYQRNANYIPEYEYATIAGISAGGMAVTLAAPLGFDHLGARDGAGKLTYLPQVSDLTRNVLIRSENALGTRGQVVFLGRADVDVEATEFLALGRTTIAPIDDTTYDAAGNVTHIGTNQADRNPVQFRNLVGPTSPQANGYQFTFVDNSVFCPIVHDEFIWPININNSSYGLIRGNEAVNWAGSGIVTKTGAEVHNRIEGNFVAAIRGTGERIDVAGTAGNGYWLRGPGNSVVGNVATDIQGGVYTYGYNLFTYYVGVVNVPAYQGADPSVAGGAIAVNMNNTPILEFAGNEVYGATPNGMTAWWIGTVSSENFTDARPSVIKDLTVWSVYGWGYFPYETNALTLDGFTDLGDSSLTANRNGGEGIHFEDYLQTNLRIVHADIQGQYIGIGSVYGSMEVADSYLRNVVDIAVGGLWTVSYTSLNVLPRHLVIRDVAFDDFTAGGYTGPSTYISMGFGTRPNHNFIQTDTVLVYNYNRVAGDDFQVYYVEQAPDYIVPLTTYNPDGSVAELGAPVEGLTNAEAWRRYGIAVAGKVATNATTRAKINGLVGPTS